MFRKRSKTHEEDVPSGTEVHRMAAFISFMELGWTPHSAALASLARHPFDDEAEPVSRDWEDVTRLASMAFTMQVRQMDDEAQVASLAADVLKGYRETAILSGEPYYSGRFDKTLEPETA